MRTDFADRVSVFLDRAAAAGVSHVTYLSARGTDSAPPETAMRRVELDLVGRPGVTHAILRSAWFMQNFSETFLKPAGGAIAVPAGEGAEDFVDADDIAAVASATLADPQPMSAPSTHSPVPTRSRSRTQPRSSATSAARLLTTPT